MNGAIPPTSIRRLSAEQLLEVSWPDGLTARLPLVPLRAECMCARCVDEITGARIVELDGIDPAIQINEMKLVGNYAVKLYWSDGHNQGLYTWDHLRRLSEAASRGTSGT